MKTAIPPRWSDTEQGRAIMASVSEIETERLRPVDIPAMRAEVEALDERVETLRIEKSFNAAASDAYAKESVRLRERRAALDDVFEARRTIGQRRELLSGMRQREEQKYCEQVEQPFFTAELQRLLPDYLEALRTAATLAAGISAVIVECNRRGVAHHGCLYPGLCFGHGTTFTVFLDRIEKHFGLKVPRGDSAPAATTFESYSDNEERSRGWTDYQTTVHAPERRQIANGLSSIARFAWQRLFGGMA
jgi:hypothetical protein